MGIIMAETASNHVRSSEMPVSVVAEEGSVLTQIMAVLKGIRPLMANGQAYDQDTMLGEAGFTSLEMVNVMLAVETAFDLMIPAGDITPGNFKTASSIAAMIGRLKPIA